MQQVTTKAIVREMDAEELLEYLQQHKATLSIKEISQCTRQYQQLTGKHIPLHTLK